jgi:hypothetical protein
MRATLKRPAALVVLALALGGCGSSSHPAAGSGSTSTAASHPNTSSTASAAALIVGLSTPKSEPKAGGFWPIIVTAHTASGAPVSGTVAYSFLFGGAVVATRAGGHMRAGVFHDRLEFPARAVGYPLTVQVNVRTLDASGSTERTVTVHP